jgi:hypothetical protein
MHNYTFQDIEDAITYPFEDPDWVNKLLILGAIALAGFVIPFLPWIFIYGYAAQITRQAALEGGLPKLPSWDDWTALLLDGLRAAGVYLVYWLPVVVLFFTAFGVIFIPTFSAIIAENTGNAGDEVVAPLLLLGVLGFFALLMLAFVVSMVVGLFVPLPLARAIVEQRFAAAFEPRPVWALVKANFGGLVITWLLIVVIGLLAGIAVQFLAVTIILAPVGAVLTTAYLPLVQAALYARLYRDAVAKVQP